MSSSSNSGSNDSENFIICRYRIFHLKINNGFVAQYIEYDERFRLNYIKIETSGSLIS